MNRIEYKELPKSVVDEDYEGLLSSYIEPEDRIKIMLSDDYSAHISKIAPPSVP